MHQRRIRHARLWGGLAATLALLAGAAGATSASAATHPGAASAIVFFVSPDGTGTACTAGDPCSLLTAQSEVRAATPTMTSDIDVVLAGGTYQLSQTLAFSAAEGDGGTNGYTVTYEAAPGADPVLSGGEQVTGWTEGSDGVWQAQVPAGTQTQQLYVNGVRANIASEAAPSGFTQTATGYTTTDTALDSWSNISDVQFVYNVAWTQMMCGVASISGATITMDEPCFQNSTLKPYGVNAGLPSEIQNAMALLTNPGQWYLNQSTDTLYYIPREGQDMQTADVEIPSLQTLVSGTGTEAQPLTGLTLSGLSFEYGGWTAPDGPDGYSEVQADIGLTGTDAYEDEGTCDIFSSTDPGTCPYGAWTMTPGNVVFSYTDGLTITSDTFQHLGASGLQLGQDTDNANISGNVFTDISANGLEIGNGTDADPSDTALLPADNTIANNWVHNVAVQYTGGVGIFQGYTDYDVIEHNQINDVPYSGISSNWGWGRTPTETEGNEIVDNLVYDWMQQHSDGGGIYVLGQEGDSMANGLLIEGNVVEDAPGSGQAIYTDGGSQYVTMTDNAAFGNNTPSMGGCYEGSGTPFGDFSFTGNYFEDLTPDWPCGAPTDATITGNTQVGSNGSGVPASLLANAGLQPAYAGIAAPPAGSAPVNLALNAPAEAEYLNGSTAEMQPGSQASYATDGNPSTFAQATNQYLWQLVVNLQQQDTLGYVTVTMPEAAYATAFHVDASTNGTTWTTVGSVTGTSWGTIPVVFSSPVTAQYLRIVADQPSEGGETGGQMAISEVGAYAATGSNPDLALDEPTQALYIDGTQALMQPNSLPSYADDGNSSTCSQATDQYRWIQQIDLQQPESIDVISLLQSTSAFATNWHIDVSLDGSSWWTVARQEDAAGGLSGVQLADPVSARYIRIIADLPAAGGQTGGQMAICEAGVYG